MVEYRALLVGCSAVLMEGNAVSMEFCGFRSLSVKCWALMVEYRALLVGCSAVLMECRVFLLESSAVLMEYCAAVVGNRKSRHSGAGR